MGNLQGRIDRNVGVLDFGEFSIEFYRILGYFEAVIIATDSLGGG